MIFGIVMTILAFMLVVLAIQSMLWLVMGVAMSLLSGDKD